jgi:flavin-dependent dehydrogenase
MDDVVIVGAGPAGAVAGAILARAGVRVRLVDRATFPRDKLCGDTINPGTLARLRSLGLSDDVDRRGLRVDGMVVTSERGLAIVGRYPRGMHGRAIVRRDLDWMLVQQAVAAGCQLDARVTVRGAIVDASGAAARVCGVAVDDNGSERALRAPVTIAADGRRSAVAFGLGLARHPDRPRRWAIGAYLENFMPLGVRPPSGPVPDPRLTSCLGEMHVRSNCYIGVAAVPGGLTNVCLVKPSRPADRDFHDPRGQLTRELARDPLLRDRAAGARLVAPPVVLGPLAVDNRSATLDGLLLAGDAAGFVDPMTGDGLRFAVRGAELAAAAALHVLEHGWHGVHARLARQRRREFAGKQRFNRALRALVASPRAIDAAAFVSRVTPAVLRAAIVRAGDCGVV